MSLTTADVQAMSNNQLDDAYAAAYNAGNSQDLTVAGLEILNRENGVLGWGESIFGYNPFPQYTALKSSGVNPNVTQIFADPVAVAQSGLAASASNVAGTLTSWGIGTGLVLALVAAAVIVFEVKR